MTSKTSLFNKGIYKSTLRRYMWGSVLYFIGLFLITALPILLGIDPTDITNYRTYNNYPLLYDEEFIFPSTIIAIGVPTVVGLLVFRFMHSKKTSIFTHSLPVSRNAVYFSSVLAGLTLMAVPVVLNGIILCIISVAGYSAMFSAGSCVIWTLTNLITLFTMFACTCFVASLTGNSFAMIGLNILFHSIIPLVTAAVGVFAETFLFGFVEISDLLEKVTEGNLAVRVIANADNLSTEYMNKTAYFGTGTVMEMAAAVVLYALAWLFYKKRNLENAEDVAGFKVLNPIFKYMITFLGAICAFAVFSSFIGKNPVVFALIVLGIAVIAYFASEMVLKKTLRVWKSYKGFIGFAAVFAVITGLFAFTSFFGYETRVPSPDEVQSVAVYNFYNYNEPFVASDEVIEHAINVHKNLVTGDRIYTIKPSESYFTRLHIKYKLKSGKEIRRAYRVEESENFNILNDLYKIDTYKKTQEAIVTKAPEDIYRINVYSDGSENVQISDAKEVKGLHEALCKDLMTLDYSQIYSDYTSAYMSIEINHAEELGREGAVRIEYADVNLNMNFKNTQKWLSENGYQDVSYYSDIKGTVYIAKTQALEEGYEKAAVLAAVMTRDNMPGADCVYLDSETEDIFEEYLRVNYFSHYPAEKEYTLFISLENGGYDVIAECSAQEIEKLAEYLFK